MVPSFLRAIKGASECDRDEHTFGEIASHLSIQRPEDWYTLNWEQVETQLGSCAVQVQSKFGGSLVHSLTSTYPEYTWQPWLFEKYSVPAKFWHKLENQAKFLEWVASKIGVRCLDQWYHVQSSDILRLGGASLLGIYGNSLQRLLESVYPEFPWQPWLFEKVPIGFWQSIRNQQRYFSWIGEQLGVETPEDIYGLQRHHIMTRGGRTLLKNFYGGSLVRSILSIFPDYPWQPWRFAFGQNHCWDGVEIKHKFLCWLADEYGLTCPESWYQIVRADVVERGGNTLLKGYEDSLVKLLTIEYPEFPWQPWRFEHVPDGFWENKDNVNTYLKWLAIQLEVYRPEDLYHISYEEIANLRGLTLAYKLGGLANLLLECFPNLNMPIIHRNKTQHSLYRKLQRYIELDPTDIHLEFKHSQISYEDSQLAIEYQGEQHYDWNWQSGSPSVQQARDISKKERCRQENVTLIQVPYWWDRKDDNLLTSICNVRPDLVKYAKGLPS